MAIVAAFVAFSQPGSESEAPPAPAVPTTIAAPAEDHDHGAELSIRRITPAELRAAIERGEAVAIDVRDADSYAAGHIVGAYHIPLALIEGQASFLPGGKLLVTYCT
jgi:predicted sulfurtransferase